MQSTNLPSKYLVPFATNDSAKVEIPVTTATVGRASQSLGFPPITGQPPETGGLPPQLEDFNGAVNQIARVAWWSMLGGQWRYDATFATDSNINGYPAGSQLQSAVDSRITWLSLADNNVVDPDATGTGWVPLTSYAPATITTAGGTTTPTLPVAAHATLIVAGTLSSNSTIILPTWVRDWTITNTTTGTFTVTVKTAAGAGISIPQNGAPTRVAGDGSNITQVASNIAPSTSPTQPLQAQQKGYSRATATGSLVVPAGVTTMFVSATAAGGGAGAGGSGSAGTGGVGGGGGGGGAGQALVRQPFTVVPGSTIAWTIGAAGVGGGATAAGAGNNGTNGGNLVISGTGFNGGVNITLNAGAAGLGGGIGIGIGIGGVGGAGFPAGAYGEDAQQSNGAGGNLTGHGGGGGMGGGGPFGGGGGNARGGTAGGINGANAAGFGAGGGGGGGPYAGAGGTGGSGGNAAPGFIMFEW